MRPNLMSVGLIALALGGGCKEAEDMTAFGKCNRKTDIESEVLSYDSQGNDAKPSMQPLCSELPDPQAKAQCTEMVSSAKLKLMSACMTFQTQSPMTCFKDKDNQIRCTNGRNVEAP